MPFPQNDPRFRGVQKEIAEVVELVFDEIMELIRQGVPPIEAVDSAIDRLDELLVPVVTSIISRQLGAEVGIIDPRAYRVGYTPLSNALYRRARQVSRDATRVIRAHAREFLDAKKLTLQLFEGYGFKEKEILDIKKELPKYLRGPFAKIKVGRLKTAALRAAYLPVVEAELEQASIARLEKRLRVAWYERNRYFASRIARTELSRIVNDRDAGEMMQEDDLEVVEVRLSAAHPVTDICDYHAGVNLWGLGPGLYPKARAPKPPFHPHCFCTLVKRYDKGDVRPVLRSGAQASYLRSLSAKDRAKVLGSSNKAAKALKGENVISLVDAKKKKVFRTKFVGEYR